VFEKESTSKYRIMVAHEWEFVRGFCLFVSTRRLSCSFVWCAS